MKMSIKNFEIPKEFENLVQRFLYYLFYCSLQKKKNQNHPKFFICILSSNFYEICQNLQNLQVILIKMKIHKIYCIYILCSKIQNFRRH